MERDIGFVINVIGVEHFNSHAHVERDEYEMTYGVVSSDFNSHAHVERDGMYTYEFKAKNISTHTLTWSVTGQVVITRGVNDISTHTLTWSVTDSSRRSQDTRTISTHTLTWSVTSSLKLSF